MVPLELGIAEPSTPMSADGAAVEEEDVSTVAPPEPQLLLVEEQKTLPAGEMSTLELAAACGFMGLPDPKAGHYFGSSDIGRALAADSSKVKLEKLGNDAKSAVAGQALEVLSRRSG